MGAGIPDKSLVMDVSLSSRKEWWTYFTQALWSKESHRTGNHEVGWDTEVI